MREIDLSHHERSSVYALFSIACPIVTIGTVYIIQTNEHSFVWNSAKEFEDGMDRAAALFTFLSDIGDLLFYMELAAVVGLLFALRSIQLRGSLTLLTYLSLGVNGAPILIAAFLWILSRF